MIIIKEGGLGGKSALTCSLHVLGCSLLSIYHPCVYTPSILQGVLACSCKDLQLNQGSCSGRTW